MGWTRVDALRRRIREYQDRTGRTQAEVAEDLGTTYGTLRWWLAGVRPPKNANLQNIVAVLGPPCSMAEFIDDPGSPPAGLPADLWDQASDQDRALAMAILEDLQGIPETEKAAYYQLWKQGIAIGRARVQAEKKQ